MPKYTQADLDNLKSALMSGASKVQVGDRNLELRSKAELMELINMVELDLAGEDSSAATDNTSVIVSRFDKQGK